jgi:hypothetical protein
VVAQVFEGDVGPVDVAHRRPVGDHSVYIKLLGDVTGTKAAQFDESVSERPAHQRLEVPQRLIAVEDHALDHGESLSDAAVGPARRPVPPGAHRYGRPL